MNTVSWSSRVSPFEVPPSAPPAVGCPPVRRNTAGIQSLICAALLATTAACQTSRSGDSDSAGSSDAFGVSDGVVFLSPDTACCDLGTPFEGQDTASLDPDTSPPIGCADDDDCGTENPCVVSVCGVGGTCSVTALLGKPCDDANVCTTGDACDAEGRCAGGASVLEESTPCVTCTCHPVTGVACDPTPSGEECDDGHCCTTNDRCVVCDGDADCNELGRACRGAATACSDLDPCTLDACACDADDQPVCSAPPAVDGAPCEADALLCTTGDSCLDGVCVAGPSVPLDDGDPCTQDLCVKGEVVHQPLNAGQCDDGNECTTADHCALGTCVGGPPVSCVVPECAGSASCVSGQGCVTAWLPEGASCAGSALCAAAFACNAEHVCAPIGPKTCDDGDLCTADACDPETGECVFTPSNAACDPGVACVNGACEPPADDCSTCPSTCLPDGTCCPIDAFCPTTDTTLSGTQSFSAVYVPVGVTVRCVGSAPLVLNVSGSVWIDGVLAADGTNAGTVSDSLVTPGACGGFAGGDGFRDCTSSATTFCEASGAAACQALISPKETWSGNACTYLAFAPGQPGDGPGGGFGGQMAHPLHNAALGRPAGGGGGSYASSGVGGTGGQTQCGALAGGAAGPPGSTANLLQGGSGGGAGGMARNNDCGSGCTAGCTAWGGDGGAGGGVVHVVATGPVTVNGLLTARGGNGGNGGGAVCTGAGGGGAGGVVRVVAPTLVTPGPGHIDAAGGKGGTSSCGPGQGAGGAGGSGVVVAP